VLARVLLQPVDVGVSGTVSGNPEIELQLDGHPVCTSITN
jgi:hypothetical protein